MTDGKDSRVFDLKQKRNRSFLAVGFLLQLVFIILITVVGINLINTIVEHFTVIVTGHNKQKDYLTIMQNSVRARSIYVWKMTLTNDLFERSKHYENFLKAGTRFLIAREKLELTPNPEQQLLLEQMDVSIKQVVPILYNVMEKLNVRIDYPYQNEMLRALLGQQHIVSTINKMFALHTELIQKVYTQITAELTYALRALLLLMGLALILGGVFAFMIYRRSQKMLFSMIRSEHALAQINEELEHRVKDRTRRLEIANKRLESMANFDVLTGLANRLMLYNQMEVILSYAKRDKHLFAVLFMDLDGFKPINDTYGHDVGDTILITIADRIRDITRESDLAARLGGDEFVIVLSKITNRDDAEIYSKKLKDCINLPIPHLNHSLQVSASVGISVYPNDGDTTELLLKNADNAMYIAKRSAQK
ncbi:diguanylate cyclase/phosphodiesterase (GGDEF & EAL domains) with PAS/PAC sensor(s) [hydrothermal vent metagenome]|uniref:Diguanylate cyclase/phosphodiesterase (GGDEF & EAL domains) with PAS/PAC sensor(S) n=1 Tax=hydrothermal vent metagenome TaxID=652676 RepID=A0A3B1A479_9ZZZZ